LAAGDQVLDVLYHYTSQKGLLGILQKKEVWATQIQYLNDEVEFSHAWSVLLDTFPPPAERDPMESSMISQVTKVLPGANFHVCVCSLSELDDELSQWRAYCSPGSGFSVGFLVEDLKALVKKTGWQLIQCTYDPAAQIKLVTELFKKHLELYSKIVEYFGGEVPAAKESIDEQIDKFIEEFVALAPRIKHPSFKGEMEWRMVSPPIPSDKLQFREGRHTVIPYFPLTYYETGPCPLRAITVGPGFHLRVAAESVRSILFKEGWPGCEVRLTKGTVRDW